MATSKSPPAKKPPALNIPASSNIVDISIINTTSRIQDLPASIFLEPSYKNLANFDCPAFSFLITHPPTGKKYLFDLGIRKDWQNLASPIAESITKNGFRLTIGKNVSEILYDAGVPPASINGIIWSHHHWDHTGNPATFPPSTTLIVGPGVKSAFTPGYPQNPDSPILESDYANRELIEVNFDDVHAGGGIKIGTFRALDFFQDGSFYLLDSPGHAVGHICGLARTTTASAGKGGKGSDTFILLGADVAHHAGELRPTPYLPLPSTLDPSPVPSHSDDDEPGVIRSPRGSIVCPGEVLARQHRLHPSNEAWVSPYILPAATGATDLAAAKASVEGAEGLDAHPEVFTCLAHDASLLDVVGFFPVEGANKWREKGWRERSMWGWVGDYWGGVVGS